MTPSNFNLLIVFRQFHGSDEQHSTEIISTDVMIIPSAGNHDKSSSHVKTNNIVDHSWDVRFYKGQLLAVHLSGKFIAFGIQGEFSYFLVHIIWICMCNKILIRAFFCSSGFQKRKHGAHSQPSKQSSLPL